MLELARLVLKSVGLNVEPEVPGLYRVGDGRHIRSDVSKLRALGWAPSRPQADMVRSYVEWARAHPDLYDSSSDAVTRMKQMGVLRSTR